MDNYPPGVTGTEDVFGPKEETEYDDIRTCTDGCPFTGEVFIIRQIFSSEAVEWWDCPTCNRNHEHDMDLSEVYPEYDEEHTDA